MLEMTYPDDYYKNVIEPAKLGKGPVPSMGQMMMKSQPFKAVSLPFQEMINPGKYGSFRSSGTPMARAITGPLSTAARTLFSAPAAGIMAALTPTPANADEASMTVEDFAALNQGVTPQNEPMDIEDFLGTSTPQDLGFIDDAPQIKEAIYQDRIMNPNLPGFAFQPKESLRNIIGSQLQNAKTKAGQGFDFAKQLPMMAFNAVAGVPFAAQAAQGLGSLLGTVFQETPEQRNFRENIATDPEYQSLVSQIPGMDQYNQIFGMGSGRGLLGAIDKRLATINRTRKRNDGILSDALKRREEKLKALRDLERQKEAEFLESQRRGRRPGTGGGGGGGVRDSGGRTGGYSYDSGGRQGFGYGLRDGGLASLTHRRG